MGKLNVFALFRKYFIPTLFGMLSMSVVTAAEGVFVGHGIGSDGIAAINICIPVLMLFTGVGLMFGAGASVVASIHLSRGKVKAARLNVTQALLAVTLVTVVPSALMLAYPSATARLLGASEHLTPLVRDYLLWFTPMLLFQVWCALCLFIIRLDGAPKLAMVCNVVAALVSVVLSWLFIIPLEMGVKGAALSGTIGMFMGSAIGLVYLFRYARRLRPCRLKWSLKSLRLSLRNVGYQCRIGSSALLTEATMAMLMFMGNHVFMKYLGDDGVGAFGIACYYMPFVFMVGNAIAQSAQPIIGACGADGNLCQLSGIGHGCYGYVAHDEDAVLTVFGSVGEQQHGARYAGDARSGLDDLQGRTQYVARRVASTGQLTVGVAVLYHEAT